MKQTLNPATYQQSEGACPAALAAGAGLTACLLKNDPASASAQRQRPPKGRGRLSGHTPVQEPWSRSESESEQGEMLPRSVVLMRPETG